MPRALSVRARGATTKMPHHVEPMLALPAASLPSDLLHYNFEWKWDGVRALAFWDGKKLRLDSRNLLDFTNSYPELQPLGKALGVKSAIFDGEIVALDEHGRPSFARLQRRMHVNDAGAIAQLMRDTPIWYVIFDLLYLDGRSTMDQPCQRRRELLEELTLEGPYWQVTPAHVGEGKAMLEAARVNALEGLVAKRLDAPYEPGRRSPAWRKIKIVQRQELVVGGWIPEKSGVSGRVGAMLVGYYDCDGKLRYAGRVGTGLRAADHARLIRAFKSHQRRSSPFADPVPRAETQFLEPSTIIEVDYRRWPAGGMIQHASYKGIREDKDARDVVREATSDNET